MTIINGYNGANHNVEDILATIRTSIAEEAGPARLVAGEVQLPARRDQHYADEAPEFELPAIFKPGHLGSAEKPKLFGRLSDALKTANPQDAPRGRTVIPFDPSATGRITEPPAQLQRSVEMQGGQPQRPQYPAQQPQQNTQYSHQHQNQAAPETARSMPDTGVKREMPTFFDTRINRLGELTRQAYEPAKAEPQPEPQAEPFRPEPPQLPQLKGIEHASDAVDDAAAQLLRPMLRQWLHENMPKIVEKALLSEVQGNSGPKTRK